MPTPKTFMVADEEGGRTLPATQLASFTHYLNAIQFRFVVTQLRGEPFMVTHRASGREVCLLPARKLVACRGDYKDAGKLALLDLITDTGEDKVFAALKKLEG